MNHAPGTGSITWPVDQQPHGLPLSYRCPLIILDVFTFHLSCMFHDDSLPRLGWWNKWVSPLFVYVPVVSSVNENRFSVCRCDSPCRFRYGYHAIPSMRYEKIRNILMEYRKVIDNTVVSHYYQLQCKSQRSAYCGTCAMWQPLKYWIVTAFFPLNS